MLQAVASPPPPPPPALQRARGEARVRMTAAGLDRLYQDGCMKVRFPRAPDDAGAEGVLINTAGGLTGGDRIGVAVDLGLGARLCVSTQACERVYRARDGVAETTVGLRAADGARIEWLPQETILFDGGALSRRIEADLAPTAGLLLVETVILGRAAMGETVRRGVLRDRWRIRRDGRLIFADDLRLEGEIEMTGARAPLLAGRRAFTALLMAAPDAETRLEGVRAALGPLGGASAFDGLLFARAAAPDGFTLRRALIAALAALRDNRPPPRMWGL